MSFSAKYIAVRERPLPIEVINFLRSIDPGEPITNCVMARRWDKILDEASQSPLPHAMKIGVDVFSGMIQPFFAYGDFVFSDRMGGVFIMGPPYAGKSFLAACFLEATHLQYATPDRQWQFGASDRATIFWHYGNWFVGNNKPRQNILGHRAPGENGEQRSGWREITCFDPKDAPEPFVVVPLRRVIYLRPQPDVQMFTVEAATPGVHPLTRAQLMHTREDGGFLQHVVFDDGLQPDIFRALAKQVTEELLAQTV